MELPLPPSQSTLAKSLSPSIGSKQPGNELFLSELVAEASLAVMPKNPRDFSVDAVRVVKILGGSLSQSRVVRGMVFGREPDGIIKKGTKMKVAVYTCGLDISQTETKATVLLKNAGEMLDFTKGEEKQMENVSRPPHLAPSFQRADELNSPSFFRPPQIFQEIATSGVKLIIAGSGIGDLALHYLNRQGIAVLKVLSKFDLRRLCRVCGATPLARVGAPTAEEAGHVDILETIEIGGDRVTVLRQEAAERTRTATIVLRGATANHLDDLERSIDDGVNTVRSLLKDGRLVPGAGATEIELAKRVGAFGEKTPGLAQHGIRKFAEALEVVPRTLAENAGLDASEVISALYKAHGEGKADQGVDIDVSTNDDALFVTRSPCWTWELISQTPLPPVPLYQQGNANGTLSTLSASILDPLAPKSYAIKLAVDAAVSVLRVDSIIVAKQAGIAPPKQNPDWDQD